MARSSRVVAIASLLTTATLCGCAVAPRTSFVEVTSGEYELTRRSGFLATSKPAELKYEAEQAALQYCVPRGGKLSVLDSRVSAAHGADFASATVLFRCS